MRYNSFEEKTEMLIQVSKIMPNPFRDMEADPLDRDKIESLKISIGTSFFWDNIMAREHPTKKGYFQLAYGHHRIVAVNELEIEEIDIPVKPLDDATMYIVMANENLPNWKSPPSSVIACVYGAKLLLQVDLDKFASWDELRSDEKVRPTFIGKIIKTQNAFNSLKGKKIGRDSICKFLGKNYSSHIVQDVLSFINNEKVDIEIAKTLPNMKQAMEFKNAVEKLAPTFGIDGIVPKEEQEKVRDKIINKSIQPEVEKAIERASAERNKEETKAVEKAKTKEEIELDKLLKKIIKTSKAMSTLNSLIDPMLTKMEEMNVDKISGLNALEFREHFILLVGSLSNLAPFFNAKVTLKEFSNE